MICTPSFAHERGISIRTSAPTVVRMNLLASPIVQLNAPSTAWPIVPKMSPRIPAVTSGKCEPVAAAAGAAPASNVATATAPATAIVLPGRIIDGARSGEDRRDHDQDQHDSPDHPKQMIRSALRASDHQACDQDQHQADAGAD